MPERAAHARPAYRIADIVRCHSKAFEASHTPALGGHLYHCPKCATEHPDYHSCRRRGCPNCQALAQETWIVARAERILPVRHFHTTFTLPSEQRKLAQSLPEAVYNSFFRIVCEIHNDDPIGNTDAMLSSINALAADDSISNLVIDMTTFTRECLMILVNILFQNRSKFTKINFIYTPAQGMSRDWLTKVFEGVRTVVGYPGNFKQANPLHLVVIAGFETERARQLIDSYEPDSITIAFGNRVDSVNNDYFDRNKQFAMELHSSLGYNVKQLLEIPLLSPTEISTRLLYYISALGDYNVAIAPLNNKISTLGCALAAIKNPDIQLCYCRAMLYNHEHYSTPSATCYLIDDAF